MQKNFFQHRNLFINKEKVQIKDKFFLTKDFSSYKIETNVDFFSLFLGFSLIFIGALFMNKILIINGVMSIFAHFFLRQNKRVYLIPKNDEITYYQNENKLVNKEKKILLIYALPGVMKSLIPFLESLNFVKIEKEVEEAFEE